MFTLLLSALAALAIAPQAAAGQRQLRLSPAAGAAPGFATPAAPLIGLPAPAPALGLSASAGMGAGVAPVSATAAGAAAAPALTQVQAALSGQAEAGEAFPGLARLGSEAAAPAQDAPAAEHSAAAGQAFLQKAGLGAQVESSGVAAPPAASQADRMPGAAQGSRLSKPRYPWREVLFNGKIFPSIAFRPYQPVESKIVEAIDAAQESVEIALYEFKSPNILAALRRAKKKGRRVQLVVDHGNLFPRPRPDKPAQRSDQLQALLDEGFDVLVLRGMHKYGINHNKFMIFDGKMAQFGSYNYTPTSELNHFENVKFTADAAHLEAFRAYWSYLRGVGVGVSEAQAHRWPRAAAPPPFQAAPSVEVNGVLFPAWLFSPDPAGEDMLVKLIETARVSIDLTMFSFRSTRIAEAVRAARGRDVKVRIILDKSQAEGPNTQPYAQWFAFHGVETRILAGPNPDGPVHSEKDHNKLVLIDGKALETGSANWSKNAFMMNFENMHLTTDPTDVSAAVLYYSDLWELAVPLAPPAARPVLPTDAELLEELLLKP